VTDPLSPAAQAVMIAATNGNFNVVNDPVYKQCIAAALRAAADLGTWSKSNEFTVPFSVINDWENVKGSCSSFYEAAKWGRAQALQEILTIATELEAQP